MVKSSIGVLDIVTEEAKNVQKLIFIKLFEVLQLVSEEVERIVFNNRVGTVLENLNKLAGELHNLS